jgi:hypothetical protein
MKQVPARNGGTLTRPDKGETANPNGRPRKLVSDVIKELENQGVKPVTKQEIQDVYMRLINLEMPDLEAKVKDGKQPALVRIVGKAILSGKGYEVVERMLDRSIGKPDSKIEHTGDMAINIADPFAKIRENNGIDGQTETSAVLPNGQKD